MKALTRRTVLAGSATLLGSACVGRVSTVFPDGGDADAGLGVDAGTNTGVDAGADAGVDAGVDAGTLVWNVPTIFFIAGNGGTFDLKTTLPAGIASTGTFDVETAAGGVALPALPPGVSLAANGVLTNSATTAESVSGIVFGYTVA